MKKALVRTTLFVLTHAGWITGILTDQQPQPVLRIANGIQQRVTEHRKKSKSEKTKAA